MRVVVYDDDGKQCYVYHVGDGDYLRPGLDERRRIADALLFAYNSVLMRMRTPAFMVIE